MRRSTLATALVAVFISCLGTPAAVKPGGYVPTDLVVNKSPLIDKNGISHTGTVDPNLLNPWGVTEIPTGSPFWVSDNAGGGATRYNFPASAPKSGAPPCPRAGRQHPHAGRPLGQEWGTDRGRLQHHNSPGPRETGIQDFGLRRRQ